MCSLHSWKASKYHQNRYIDVLRGHVTCIRCSRGALTNGLAISDRVHYRGNTIEGLTPVWIWQSAVKKSSGVRKRIRNLKKGQETPIPGFCQKAFLFNHNFDAFERFCAAYSVALSSSLYGFFDKCI